MTRADLFKMGSHLADDSACSPAAEEPLIHEVNQTAVGLPIGLLFFSNHHLHHLCAQDSLSERDSERDYFPPVFEV
jgi:hypothetical protein